MGLWLSMVQFVQIVQMVQNVLNGLNGLNILNLVRLQACHSISTQPTSTAQSGFIACSARKEWLDGRARRCRIDTPMRIPAR